MKYSNTVRIIDEPDPPYIINGNVKNSPLLNIRPVFSISKVNLAIVKYRLIVL